MYGPLVSVLLMGMLPVWGIAENVPSVSGEITVAPPAAFVLGKLPFIALDGVISASGVLILDLESGQSLFERAPDIARPMASLTKLMTALLIVENHSLDAIVTIPLDIEDTVGTVAHLPPGERFTVGNLLSALLVMSANDAAVTLARFHSGSVSDFALAMNARAVELGLKHTSYQNPAGLDSPLQESSPRDLAWLTMFVMRRPEIADRMAIRAMRIVSLEGQTIPLSHTHALLHEDTLVIAGKTGTTEAAGQCLLSLVEVKQRRLIVILLHSADRYADMRSILRTFAD